MNKFWPGYTIPINLQINYRGVVAHNMLEGQQPSLFQTFVTSFSGLNMLNFNIRHYCCMENTLERFIDFNNHLRNPKT